MTRLGVVLLLVTFACASTDEWQRDLMGLIRWKTDCRFSGNSKLQRALPEDCATLCFVNKACNRFSWDIDIGCQLHIKGETGEKDHFGIGSLCGKIPGR